MATPPASSEDNEGDEDNDDNSEEDSGNLLTDIWGYIADILDGDQEQNE
jgi:hypothetical protein